MAVEEFLKFFASVVAFENMVRDLNKGWSARQKKMPRLRNVQDWHDSVRKDATLSQDELGICNVCGGVL
jgi:hypothetical protein